MVSEVFSKVPAKHIFIDLGIILDVILESFSKLFDYRDSFIFDGSGDPFRYISGVFVRAHVRTAFQHDNFGRSREAILTPVAATFRISFQSEFEYAF